MILEIAHIIIRDGTQAEFESAASQAEALFRQARGCRSFSLRKGIEQPTHYRLLVQWETLEDHTVHFRQSSAFQSWRALVGPFFASAPDVEHFENAVTGF